MLTEVEFKILNFIQELRTPFLDSSMKLFSFLGSTAIVWVLLAVILLVKKDSRKSGIVMGVSMILALIIGGLILKHIFLRVRPFNDPLGLLTARNLIISPPSDKFSFPSSHAGTSFAAATSVFLWNKRHGAMAFVLAVLIALSRIYLYVHFPTDILAGAFLGIVCSVLANKIVCKNQLASN